MKEEILQVEFKVRSVQAQILQYFTGYEELLKKMVEEQLSTKNIIASIRAEIDSTIKWKINNAIDEVVKAEVKKSKELNNKIEALVKNAVSLIKSNK